MRVLFDFVVVKLVVYEFFQPLLIEVMSVILIMAILEASIEDFLQGELIFWDVRVPTLMVMVHKLLPPDTEFII